MKTLSGNTLAQLELVLAIEAGNPAKVATLSTEDVLGLDISGRALFDLAVWVRAHNHRACWLTDKVCLWMDFARAVMNEEQATDAALQTAGLLRISQILPLEESARTFVEIMAEFYRSNLPACVVRAPGKFFVVRPIEGTVDPEPELDAAPDPALREEAFA